MITSADTQNDIPTQDGMNQQNNIAIQQDMTTHQVYQPIIGSDMYAQASVVRRLYSMNNPLNMGKTL